MIAPLAATGCNTMAKKITILSLLPLFFCGSAKVCCVFSPDLAKCIKNYHKDFVLARKYIVFLFFLIRSAWARSCASLAGGERRCVQQLGSALLCSAPGRPLHACHCAKALATSLRCEAALSHWRSGPDVHSRALINTHTDHTSVFLLLTYVNHVDMDHQDEHIKTALVPIYTQEPLSPRRQLGLQGTG